METTNDETTFILVNYRLYNSTLQKCYNGLGVSFCSTLSKLQTIKNLSDKILLPRTSYVSIIARRYLFFGNQNKGSGVLKNFQAAKGLYGKRSYIFGWEFMLISDLWLTFSLCSILVSWGEMFIKRSQIQLD